MLIANIRTLKSTLKSSGRGNLFGLWDFWANKCSTFSCISYFVLESIKASYLDTYD